jgi:hypothetical protein
VLNISVSDASQIKNFDILPYSDENQKIQLFDEFIRNLDTSTIKAIDFNNYLKNFNSLDARFHQISLESYDRSLAKKVQSAILNSIANNNYFKLQKQANDTNLELQSDLYAKQLEEIDELLYFYQELMLKQAEFPMQGTNINLAGQEETRSKELSLLEERERIKRRIIELNEEQAYKASIINVISDFPTQGAELDGFWDRYMFVLPLGLLALMTMILALIGLNRYLESYKQRKNVIRTKH